LHTVENADESDETFIVTKDDVLSFVHEKIKDDDPQIRFAAYVVLFSNHREGKAVLPEALKDSSPAIFQRGLRYVSKSKGCDLLDSAKARINSMQPPNERFILNDLLDQAHERCAK